MKEVWAWITAFFAGNETAWRIVLIIIISLVSWWILRILIRRSVEQIVHGVKKSQHIDSTQEIKVSGLVKERSIQRTRTLGAVGRSISTWVVFCVALILVLGELGVNLTALLASAGFIGAGLAFGAQNIVKDVLNGIFMVFEDQLGVGDWINVGTIEGTVEDVGVRVTQIRAIDGTLWFVRNGEILMLGNSSQGHSQAIIDVTVRADQDLDRVQEVMLEAGRALLANPEYKRKITGNPEMWGVQSISSDRATVRFSIRTRPEAHWSVQRAALKEIKKQFANEGIRMAKQLPDLQDLQGLPGLNGEAKS